MATRWSRTDEPARAVDPDSAPTVAHGPGSPDAAAIAAAARGEALPAVTEPSAIAAGAERWRAFADSPPLFPVALGASTFGWTLADDVASSLMDRFAEHGGNFIDTADSYAAGRSEQMIGTWMRKRRLRDHMLVSTKIGRHPDAPGLGPVNMVRAVEASLTRLQTDRIDVLYLHNEDPDVPLEDTLGTAQWLIDSGKVRSLGASNFSPERLVEARIMAAAGYPLLGALQTHYSLLSRGPFEGNLDIVARGQGIAVMAYFALESGFLSGRYRQRGDLDGSTRATRAGRHLNRRGLRVLRALDRVSDDHGVAPAVAAIAWLLARPGVAAPVVGASSLSQVDDLVKAASLSLSPRGQETLEAATRTHAHRGRLP